MTQRDLTYVGGTEMVTVELAKELAERGHEVAVYSPRTGRIANIMIASGVWVRDRLADIPWVPDVIHGQHHLQTMAALAKFKETPAVYYCHGVLPWVERPPVHPRISSYLMMCEWLVPRTGPDYGLPAGKVAALPNFVNLTRFTRVRTPPATPRRAALFGGWLAPDEVDRLESACEALSLRLDKIGYNHDNPLERPEIFLQDYDVVFAIGRCALEALACGCAVIPVMPGQAGELITPINFSQYAYSNFSPRYFVSANQISTVWLGEQLASYRTEEVLAVTSLVRQRHSLHGAVDRLLEVYEQAVREGPSLARGETVADFAPYMEGVGRDADAFWTELEGLRARRAAEIRELKDLRQALRRAERAREKLESDTANLKLRHELISQMLREHWMGRWILGRVKRLLQAPSEPGVKVSHQQTKGENSAAASPT